MKFAKHLILSAALVTGLSVQSPKSEAMVGLALIPGSVLMVPVIIGSAVLIADGMQNGLYGGHGLNALLGLVIFDQNSNELEMRAINAESASRLNLSESEMTSYNSELETINLALSEMNSTLTNASAESLENTKIESLAKFKSEISADSFSAIQKIMQASVQK